MVNQVDTAEVSVWGKMVGAVSWIREQAYAVFEYSLEFLETGIDLSPIHMGRQDALRGSRIYSFPNLQKGTFYGLPGLLADALPDKFGNALIDQWLAREGREPNSFSPVERLCYMGTRGMGALEFKPVLLRKTDTTVPVDVSSLVQLAEEVMQHRQQLDTTIGDADETKNAILDIIRVGTSAGGARPKAVLAINDDTNSIVSGQGTPPPGYTHWILKFDGVTDAELGSSKGYGRIEYAYYKLATACGITMTPCRLLMENDRAHFMTQRFDRNRSKKIHTQSLCGIAHYDFNMAGAYGYEQAFAVMRRLRLPYSAAEQMYRRMIFNVIARNQDDHTKNIEFLLSENGNWELSPAFDITYSYKPGGKWTDQHQMSINGKRKGFTREDLLSVGTQFNIKHPGDIIDLVTEKVAGWPQIAKEEGVAPQWIQEIASNHRLSFARRS